MAEIWIYDVIGEGFFEEGTTAKKVRDELASIGSEADIEVHINSAGGDVFEAVAIKTLLEQAENAVNVQVDGVAASAASVIMLAGNSISMAEGSMVMIHEPWGLTVGDEADHLAQAQALGKVAENLAAMYAQRSQKDDDEIRELMRAETWLTSSDAIELGLVDSITDTPPRAFKIPAEFGYKNAPKSAKMPTKNPPKPTSLSVSAMKRRIELTRRAARL